jgi:hypothetical protein
MFVFRSGWKIFRTMGGAQARSRRLLRKVYRKNRSCPAQFLVIELQNCWSTQLNCPQGYLIKA